MSEIMKRVRLLFGPISIVCLWFGTYVGPAVVSGTTQTSFLLRPSWLGVFVGPIIICLVTGTIVYFVLEYARRFELYNYRDFYDRVYGKYSPIFANFKDFTMIIAAICLASLVTALGGVFLSQILPISVQIGSLLTALLVIILVMFGRDVVRNSSAILTIAMIVMLVSVLAIGVGPSLKGAIEYHKSGTTTMPMSKIIFQFVVYSNFFLTFTDAAYPQLKGVLNSKKDVWLTVVIGVVLNILCTLGTTVILAAGIPDTLSSPTPIMWMLENKLNVSTIIGLMYIIISYLALLSTIVGWMYAFVDRYDRIMGKALKKIPSSIRRTGLLVMVMGVSIALSSFGVLAIVQNGYSLLSMLSVPVFYLPFLIILPYQMKRAKSKSLEA